MPKSPSWIDKVEFITFFASNPCDTPMWVYIEAAQKPASRAALALLSFGLLDIVRSFFRPKGLRSARHGRKGWRSRKNRGGIPEIADILARRLPGASFVKARKVDDGVKVLWIIDNYFQRVLYHWMIIDVSTDFIFETLIGVITDPATKCGTTSRCGRANINQTVIPLTYWRALGLGVHRYTVGNCSTETFTANLGEGDWFMFLTARARAGLNPQTKVNLRLRTLLATENVEYTAGEQTLGPGETTDLMCTGRVRGPCSVIYECGGGLESWSCDDAEFAAIRMDQ